MRYTKARCVGNVWKRRYNGYITCVDHRGRILTMGDGTSVAGIPLLLSRGHSLLGEKILDLIEDRERRHLNTVGGIQREGSN